KKNEIRAKRLACTANPLALVAQQQLVYHPQNHPTYYTQNSSTRSQQATTINRGKAIVNSAPPIYDQKPTIVAEDDEMSKDKEIDKLMALISLAFKKIYKPTNNNLRTSSNTSRANQDNSPRINRGTGYDNQRIGNVAGATETVEQADWRDDTDDEPEDQELEAHYMYMAQIQEVTRDAADNSGPIFDSEPLQKVSNNDNYNVFAIESKDPEQSKSVTDTYPIEQDEHNVIIDSLDMSYDREQLDQDDDDDLANEPHESDEVIRLEKESRSKLSDLIRPFDYEMLNNLYDLFVPQREKSINADLEKFHLCLKEEMIADLRYFNSLELEVDSLKSQLETQKTQFLNEIDRLSWEYYYADHMNAIFGVYTELDEVTNLQSCARCVTTETELKMEFFNNECYDIDVKRNVEDMETLNIELDHKVTKLATENDHLKQTYKQLYDSIKSSRVRSKEQCDDLIKKVNLKSAEVYNLNARLHEKVLVITALKEQLDKLKGKAILTEAVSLNPIDP
nr:hypothetical protein [Tanacetum cinerariifolium]